MADGPERRTLYEGEKISTKNLVTRGIGLVKRMLAISVFLIYVLVNSFFLNWLFMGEISFKLKDLWLFFILSILVIGLIVIIVELVADWSSDWDDDLEEKLISEEGKIATLYEAIKSGNTNYFFKLEGDEIWYVSSIENSDKQVAMKAGDTVEIQFFDAEEEGVGIVKKITIK